jgi:agmatine deiminase
MRASALRDASSGAVFDRAPAAATSAAMEQRRMPAEWEPHRAVWLAWPSHAELWGEDELASAQDEFVGLCTAVADAIPGTRRGEALEIVCRTDEDEQRARERLGALGARTHRAEYGDIWLRDTAPIFVEVDGALRPQVFRFNGWGGKYELPGDAELGRAIAGFSGWPADLHDLVLEGGAIELDGEGTLLTTKQCLLNPNRNPHLDQRAIEERLRAIFGVERILWLDEGLLHDHTDGHIDTIARFVAPGRVVCMAPSGEDPNHEVLERIARDLSRMKDARGRSLDVVRVPSPGRVTGRVDDGEDVMPASHVNFYVGNTTVVVPVYGTPWDEAVVEALAPVFSDRKVVGRSCRTILEGGGGFHCITQQEPLAPR